MNDKEKVQEIFDRVVGAGAAKKLTDALDILATMQFADWQLVKGALKEEGGKSKDTRFTIFGGSLMKAVTLWINLTSEKE